MNFSEFVVDFFRMLSLVVVNKLNIAGFPRHVQYPPHRLCVMSSLGG